MSDKKKPKEPPVQGVYRPKPRVELPDQRDVAPWLKPGGWKPKQSGPPIKEKKPEGSTEPEWNPEYGYGKKPARKAVNGIIKR